MIMIILLVMFLLMTKVYIMILNLLQGNLQSVVVLMKDLLYRKV